MNNTDLLLIALAGAAVWFFSNQAKAGSSNTVMNLGKAINGISEIFTGAKSGQVGAGWRYFSDGTSISPTGVYYLNGVEVWAPK